MRKKRPTRCESSDQRRKQGHQQDAPAAIGQEDQKSEADKDTKKPHEPRSDVVEKDVEVESGALTEIGRASCRERV